MQKKSENKLGIIFDISSGSIGGAIVSYPTDEKKPPELLFSVRNIISPKHEEDFDKFFKLTLSAIEKTASELLESRIGAPEGILITLASPWAVSNKILVSKKERSSFKYTEKIYRELAEKDVELQSDQNINVFKKQLMRTRLNGYPALNPYGQNAKEAELEFFESSVSENTRGKIKEVIEKYFTLEPVFHSSIFSLYTNIKRLYPNDDDLVIIDVGGEMTEIAIVKNDVLESLATFPIGENNMIRDLNREMKLENLDEAFSIFKMFFQDKLDKKNYDTVDSILAISRKNWMSALESGFNELIKSGLLPKNIFISANRNLESWVYEEIASGELNHFIKNHESTIGTLLDDEELKKYMNYRAGENFDSALALIALFGRTTFQDKK